VSTAFGQLALVAVFVCAQATMNLYMKFVMSAVTVAPGLHGVPASFLITCLQQGVSFVLFIAFIACRRASSGPCILGRRKLAFKEVCLICCLAVSFALNLGLNNFSLAFIPLSVNQVIRACMPLVTAVLQRFSGREGGISRSEWLFMGIGVACAVMSIIARTEGRLSSNEGFLFGACICFGSVAFGAADLVLKQVTKTKLRLSPIDAMGFMALPSLFFLLLPAVFWHHMVPHEWARCLGASASWTDLDVLSRGYTLRPVLLIIIGFSGVLAFGYNILSTFFAGRLSATTASLVGTLPTSTLISLVLLEGRQPSGMWGLALWASVVGNVVAFAAYKAAKERRAARAG